MDRCFKLDAPKWTFTIPPLQGMVCKIDLNVILFEKNAFFQGYDVLLSVF